MKKKIFRLITISALIFFIAFFCCYVPFYNKNNLYNSDDSPAYRTIKNYGDTGNIYLEGEFLDYDIGNNLHQRGFINWDNKLVYFNFLGLPLFYGSIYTILGDSTKILNIILLFIFIIYLYKLLIIFLDKKSDKSYFVYFLLSVLASLPLVYLMQFTYLNIVPASLFFIIGFYYLLVFNKKKYPLYFYLSLTLFLTSIWFRYDYSLFVILIFLVNFFNNKECYLNQRKKILKIFFILMILIIFFIFPLMFLNNHLYGSPFSYGYHIFNKVHFGEQRTGNIYISIFNMVFPAESFNFILLIQNIIVSFLLIFPIYYIISFLFIFKNFEQIKKYWPYYIIIIYFLIYFGMLNVWGSENPLNESLDKAVFRYWFLLETIFILMFTAGFIKLRNKFFKILIVFGVIVISILYQINSPTGILNQIKTIDNYEKNLVLLDSLTKNDDYLISARHDKYYYKIIHPITWWAGARKSESDKFFSSENVADITKLLISNNRDVYYLEDPINSYYIPALQEQGLIFTDIPEFPGLYKISI